VKPGRVMFEMDGVELTVAKEAMRLAMFKLPIKCKFVTRFQAVNAANAAARDAGPLPMTKAGRNALKAQAAEDAAGGPEPTAVAAVATEEQE
jgi:hypothetical protein